MKASQISSAPIQHIKAVGKGGQVTLPSEVADEVAFIGRSNVGKSSLLNAILGRKKLAKTSNTPGATRSLHFYHVGEPTAFTLVDLPGYGFAKLGRETADNLAMRTRTYLEKRKNLKCVFVLVDARRGLKNLDHDMLEALHAHGIAAAVVFTKVDKTPQSAHQALEAQAAEVSETIFMTSSIKKSGIDELREFILKQ